MQWNVIAVNYRWCRHFHSRMTLHAIAPDYDAKDDVPEFFQRESFNEGASSDDVVDLDPDPDRYSMGPSAR